MLTDNVRGLIKARRMLKRGSTVLAAVSGGADSMALLHLLNGLKEELKIKIVVCHLNHNLRGRESRRDYEFVRKAALKLDLKFEGRTLGKGELKGSNIQEKARERRYEFLEEAAEKYGAGRIALGHTLDDQAETVLMRLLKGSSSSGLAGIPPVRGSCIRPLIESSRSEIESFLHNKGIKFVTDSSNLSSKYLRNDIRLNLIPYIRKRYNPGITVTLGRLSAILAADDEFLRSTAARSFKKALIEDSGGSLVMDRLRLKKLHRAVAARVLLQGIGLLREETNVFGPHIDSLMRLIEGERPNAEVRLSGGLRAVREYDRITLTTGKKAQVRPFEKRLKVPGITEIDGLSCSFRATLLKSPPKSFVRSASTAYFDADEANGTLILRNMRPGDRITPFGMKGRKKVKEIFIENKVPKGERKTVPLLCSGAEVLWVAGLKRSEACRVGARTRAVLKVECIKAAL